MVCGNSWAFALSSYDVPTHVALYDADAAGLGAGLAAGVGAAAELAAGAVELAACTSLSLSKYLPVLSPSFAESLSP